jgi:hypothetical protein
MGSDGADGDEARSLGWDAVNGALRPIYGEQEPGHYAPALPMILGGSEPLQGISVYRNADEQPHWHYVTYGFSELYEKEWQDPEYSGFGFELTFRLAADLVPEKFATAEPPAWPLNFLQNIAKYVFKTGNVFDVGHHVNLNGPIALDEPTEIKAIVFDLDPQLGAIESPNGKVKFLQVVGLCLDEYEIAKQWSSRGILNELAAESSLLITGLYRDSLLVDAGRAERIRSAADAEGSTQSGLYCTLLKVEQTPGLLAVTVAANIVDDLLAMFERRMVHGKSFYVQGPNCFVVFKPGDAFGFEADADRATVMIPESLRREFLESVQVRRGTYAFRSAEEFAFEIVRTEIKDGDGKVIRVVG